jgi:hypothetical protein
LERCGYSRLALGMTFMASLATAQNLVQNPGFESVSIAPWVASNYGGNGGSHWAVSSGSGAHSGTKYASTGCNGSTGGTCIAPDPGAGSWLYQDLTTVPGTRYTLTFYYAPGSALGGGNAELQVLWGPSATPLTTGGNRSCTGNCVFDNTSLGSLAYTQYTVNLTATSTSMRLEFLGRQDPQVDFLDDISVTAVTATVASVPTLLPSSLLLAMVGLLCVGLYMGRRRIEATAGARPDGFRR